MLKKIKMILVIILILCSSAHAMEDKGEQLAAKLAEIEQKTYELNADTTYPRNITPLMYCIKTPQYWDYVEHFLDQVNERTPLGYTALMAAALIKHEEIVRCLLESGADINAQGYDGKAVLDYAIRRKDLALDDDSYERIINMLQAAKAEKSVAQMVIEVSNSEGGDSSDELFMRDDEDDEIYLDTSDSDSAHFSEGDHKKIFYSSGAIKEAVIKDTKLLNNEGLVVTPLMTIILLPKYITYLPLFLDETINARSQDGNTALMYAVKTDQFDVVRTLLSSGADADMANDLGETALDIARLYNYDQIADLLTQKSGKLATQDAHISPMQIDDVLRASSDGQPIQDFAFFTQEAGQCGQMVDQTLPIEPDQAEVEQDESDSDKLFTLHESSFQDERDQQEDEVACFSDVEFTVDVNSFDQETNLMKDGNSSEETEGPAPDDSVPAVEKSFKCKKSGCDKAYYSKGSLKRHKQIADKNQKPYRCSVEECAFRTGYSTDLKRHECTHTGKKMFVCPVPSCRKRFSRKAHLDVHRDTHTLEKNYCCDQCPKAFRQSAHLVRHKNARHNNITYACDIGGCIFTTPYKHNLAAHIRRHNGERPYACNFRGCKKRFVQIQDLNQHLLIHTKEKPHKCDECDYETAKKSHLTRHKKSVHK